MSRKIKHVFYAVLGLVAITYLSGCATTMSSKEYNIDMVSKKPGVKFKVYNRKGEYVHQGTTPEYVVIPAYSGRFEKNILTIKADNGQERKLIATITPIYWGNCLNLIGFAVDGITGAMWSLPDKVDLDETANDDAIVNTNF